VQETFVRAWRGLDRFEGRASVRTWLHRIATNVCLDALSDTSRRMRPIEERPSGSIDSPLETLDRTHWLEPVPDGRVLPADGDPRRYETFLRSRPREAENEAVALMLRLCRETGARVHVVHHSSADALPMLREAKDEGLPVTAETCPHYLVFAAEEIPDGATEFKCCPPVRERENREQLWGALRDGTIDMVVSDHSPCPPALKRREEGDFLQAWGGISSLQFRLPVMWTEARRRGHTLEDLARWLAFEPAKLAGLEERKGAIATGRDADLVVFDPDAAMRVTPEANEHRHKLTPYDGRELRGVVEATYLRGEKIYDRSNFSDGPTGRLLRRDND